MRDQSDYQLDFSKQHTRQMYDKDLREQKAQKVLAVVHDWVESTGRVEGDLSLLDVGCSTGYFGNLCGKHFGQVVGIDIDEGAVLHAQQRFARDGVSFQVENSLNTSFESASFDVITCSQIYEHVPDPAQLMAEIYRLLKPGGACYFAAGNRLVLIEPHYRLPLLSVFPKAIGNLYLRLAGRGGPYYENHLFLRGLRRLVQNFETLDYTRRIIEDPVTFCAVDMLEPGSRKQRLSLKLLNVAYWLCPTYVWMLVKPSV